MAAHRRRGGAGGAPAQREPAADTRYAGIHRHAHAPPRGARREPSRAPVRRRFLLRRKRTRPVRSPLHQRGLPPELAPARQAALMRGKASRMYARRRQTLNTLLTSSVVERPIMITLVPQAITL